MKIWFGRTQKRWATLPWARASNWQIFGAGLVAGVALWRGVFSRGLCHLPVAVKATNFDDRTWCFEFWFNRYQGLLGGMATLFAAFLAYGAVQRQIRSGLVSEVKRDLSVLRGMMDAIGWSTELALALDQTDAEFYLDLNGGDCREHAAQVVARLKVIEEARNRFFALGLQTTHDHVLSKALRGFRYSSDSALQTARRFWREIIQSCKPESEQLYFVGDPKTVIEDSRRLLADAFYDLDLKGSVTADCLAAEISRLESYVLAETKRAF